MNYTWKTVYGDQRLVDLARQLRDESSDSEEEEVNDDDSDEYDSDKYVFVNEEDDDDNDEEEDASSSDEEEVKESKYDKRLIKIWNKRFEQLKKYKAKHGHCNVPKQYHANKTLAVWVYTQRQQYKKLLEGLKTCMTDERVRILESIGFEWAPMKDAWNNRFDELKIFKARNGHCNVPHKYEPNKTLAGWVHTQRDQFQLMSKGSNTQITEDRIKQLNDIDFEWAPKKDAWYDRFEELEKYKEQNGHCNVPYNYIANKALGGWVHTQRDQFQLMSKGSNAKITEERVKLLDNIGFEWTPMKSAWNEKFEELKKYKAQNGHCNVPKQHHANKSLAHWVQSQRRQYKAMMDGSKSQIVEELIKKLESIGFEWTPMKDAWNDRFEELKIFKARYGHCNVPRVYEPNKTLGGWVNKQRRQYKLMVEGVHSQMTEERIEKLESIGFEWALRSKWNDRFEKLKEFKTRHGHCNVPREHEPIKSLGNWVHQQRTEYKLMLEGAKSQMTEERVEKLESLGFEWRILKKRRIAHKNATVKRLSKRLRSKK